MKYEMEGKSTRIKKKVFAIMILSISILFCLLINPNYAVNEANENTNTSDTNTSNTTNTTSTTTAKSNNANLSNLGITPHDFKGFKSETTSYEVTVPENTETVEVYAKVQNAKATVTGTGKKNLEKGENKVEVVVTAEDGTKKTYTINIIREIQQEEYGNTAKVTENSNGLSELKISNLSLSPEFKTDIYEYSTKYIGEETKVNIETKPTSEDYIVEVTGNENLQEGENIITILVSEKNGDNVATYQITLNKSLVDEEAIAREEAEKKEKQQKTIIGVVIAVVILIAIILFMVIRNRRNKELAEEFSGTSFYDEENDEEEYEEEIPRALKEKKIKEEYDDNDEEEYEIDEIENMPKEELKEKFLNNYSNYEEEYEEEQKETKRREKRKGKRFK